MLQDTKSTYPNQLFLFTGTKLLKKLENNLIHSSIKSNKILKNKSNQGHARYTENYEILMREIEEDTHKKWKDTLCPWIGGINVVKTSILPKVISRFSKAHSVKMYFCACD